MISAVVDPLLLEVTGLAAKLSSSELENCETGGLLADVNWAHKIGKLGTQPN